MERVFPTRQSHEVATYFLHTLGGAAPQADGAALERQLLDRGLVRAGTMGEAEVVVLNTCTVTASADRDVRSTIRRIHRENPASRILVTGCYAQRAPEEIAALPGVSLVVGNSHKHQLAEIVRATAAQSVGESGSSVFEQGDALVLEQRDALNFGWRSASGAAIETASHPRALAPEGPAFVPLTTLTASPADREPEAGSAIFVSDIFAHTELLAAPVFDAANERTRPNLKVQDGCDNRCSFCVIPYVRGQSRSMKPDQILQEVNTLVAAGYRELVISGINLGR